MTEAIAVQKRVVFNFEIDFSNGGGLQGQEFRLDIEGVRILRKRVIVEAHKRTD